MGHESPKATTPLSFGHGPGLIVPADLNQPVTTEVNDGWDSSMTYDVEKHLRLTVVELVKKADNNRPHG